MSLENAILKTLAYSDIFDYPLTAEELHRFLVMPAEKDDVEQSVAKMKNISMNNGYYFLKNRHEIVGLRRNREAISAEVFKRAMFYGHILGTLPFIRIVALTGSLAVLNLSKNPDMDYMLIARQGRVWTARAFAILLAKIASLFGDTICPNLIVSEQALELPVHDLYSARELSQMIPIIGNDFYRRLWEANLWVKDILPNTNPMDCEVSKISLAWEMGEIPLQGWLGNKIELWEMTRKIKKFSAQPGFGAETVFTADVCQGNFHHYRKWTYDLYQERLSVLEIENMERRP